MSVNTLLAWLGRLPVGALAIAGLALLVLAAVAPLVSATWSIPLAAGAVALWLVAVAAVVAAQTLRRTGPDRRPAAAVPAAVPLVLALVAAGFAGQRLGVIPPGSVGTGAEDVAGATATVPPALSSAPASLTAGGSPVSEASPEPTVLPAPSPTLHHGRVDLASVHITSPASRGDTVTVTATTNPWTPCTIRVDYSGASASSGLDPTVADGSGTASWTWTIASDAPLGTWPVRVTCAAGAWSAWFTVTLAIR